MIAFPCKENKSTIATGSSDEVLSTDVLRVFFFFSLYNTGYVAEPTSRATCADAGMAKKRKSAQTSQPAAKSQKKQKDTGGEAKERNEAALGE